LVTIKKKILKSVISMKVILNSDAIQNIKMFQTITSANALDCIENDDMIYFVLKGADYRIAVSGGRQKIRIAERRFKKKIKVFELSKNLTTFVKRIVPEAFDIKIDKKIIKLKVKNYDKPKVIGKNKKNLIVIKSFLKRFFDIEDVKII